jgi:hypothetical protein
VRPVVSHRSPVVSRQTPDARCQILVTPVQPGTRIMTWGRATKVGAILGQVPQKLATGDWRLGADSEL